MPSWGVELPDDAWVIRGGLNSLVTLTNSVEKSLVEWERPALSIFAGDAPSPLDVIEASGVPHPQICVSTVGRLRAAGFTEIEQTLDPPHYSIWLPAEWEACLDRFREAFDLPRPRSSFTRAQ